MAKVSYTLEKKKEKLIKQREQMSWHLHIMTVPLVASTLSGIYIICSLDKFFYYVFPFFSVDSSISSQIKRIDLAILYIFVITATISVIIYFGFKNLKDKYDSLRKNVIENIDADFCSCNNSCNCKDEFIKEMESKKIDLIFEK